MAAVTLAERVAALEQLVAQWLHPPERNTMSNDWRRTVGMFDSDPIMQESIAASQHLILLDTGHIIDIPFANTGTACRRSVL